VVSIFFFSSSILSGRRLDVYHIHDVALVRIVHSEMCCTRLAEIQDAKIRHLRTIAQLCQATFSELRHVRIVVVFHLHC